MQNAIKKTGLSSTKTIAKVGVLSAIAYVLMFISVPLPIFPSFLKIDLSDIPAIFGGMSLGPMAGLAIVIVKNFLQGITASTTGGVGEFANIVIGGSYVLIICLFYRKLKGTKGVISWRISRNSSNDYYGMYNELLYNDAIICNSIWYAFRSNYTNGYSNKS